LGNQTKVNASSLESPVFASARQANRKQQSVIEYLLEENKVLTV